MSKEEKLQKVKTYFISLGFSPAFIDWNTFDEKLLDEYVKEYRKK